MQINVISLLKNHVQVDISTKKWVNYFSVSLWKYKDNKRYFMKKNMHLC